MVKNKILQNAIDGKTQDIKMFELIALCSLHLDEFSTEDCIKISSHYKMIFDVSTDENGKKFVYVSKNGKPKKEAEKRLFDLMLSNNLSFDKSKIKICGA